jgi:hypothetical protein
VERDSTPGAGEEELGWADDPIVDDPEALEAAERAVANVDASEPYGQFDASWVEVLGPISLVNVTGPLTAFGITAPLQAAAIPYVWSPFPPEALTGVRPELMNAQRFRLFVPPEFAALARECLDERWSGSSE